MGHYHGPGSMLEFACIKVSYSGVQLNSVIEITCQSVLTLQGDGSADRIGCRMRRASLIAKASQDIRTW